jgi:hypothetical protein
MRTTLTIDDDVALGIRRIQQKRPQTPFKEIVNQLLMKGLQAEGEVKHRGERFQIKSAPAVPRPGLNFDSTQELLSLIEGDDRKW